MKKLAYLLILSLCLNGLAGVTSPWVQTAQAATKSEKKDSSKADSKEKSSKKSDKKEAEDKKASDNKKKTKVKKEKEYILDLAENNQVALSVVLEYAKLGIKLKEVKSIEYEDKKDKKLISWKPDKENEGDYIITVLKDFKEVRLRVVTKKTSKLIVLQNGVKVSKTAEEMVLEDPATVDPSEGLIEQRDSGAGDSPETDPDTLQIEPEPAQPEQTAETGQVPSADAESETPTNTPSEEMIETADEAPVEDSPGSTDDISETPETVPTDIPEPDPGSEPPEAEKQTESGYGNETDESTDIADTEEVALALEPETITEPSQDAQVSTEDQPAAETSQAASGDSSDVSAEIPSESAGESGSTESQGADGQSQDEAAQSQDETAAPSAEGTQSQAPTSEAPSVEEPASEDPASEDPESEDPALGDSESEATDELAEQTPEAGQDEDLTDDETTEAGSGEDTDDPQPETGAQIPTQAEVWFKRGNELLWGTLEEIVSQLIGGETVYIQSGSTMFVPAAPLAVLSTVTLVPDRDVFKGSYSVCISMENPTEVAEPSLLQPEQLPSIGEKADLYVWVVQDANTPTEEEDEDKPTLTVSVTGLVESGWTRTQPQFTLSGIPEGKTWTYAAIIYDERIVPIAADMYAPENEGVSTLRFAMLDELGDIMSASDQYTLQLDWTAPEVSIEVDEETSYTLEISASDNVSGLDAVTIDNGKTWHSIEEGSYTVTETAEKTFAVGAIQVRDIAGNVFKSEEEYTVTAVEGEEEGEEEEGGGGGGGGGGNGTGTPRLPHASGDGEEGADYDALALELPDEPMRQLTVGGAPMDLTLMLASAQAPNAPVGTNQPFTAQLRHWKDASDSEAPNTLMLNAEMDENLGDVFSYEWHFNGEVYRMLANSGIKYVALKVDDAVAAFPTEGFTGGTKYTELKMQGVSTRRFDYTLTMRLNLDPNHVSAMTESDYSQNCDLSIHAEVEDKNYELSNSPQSMMYFYNVFVGPEDMMDQPFGEYDAAA